MNQLDILTTIDPSTPLQYPFGLIEAFPVAAYACDDRGRILWFNRKAEALWGRSPRVGDDTELFCGSYRLHFDGCEIPRSETPMAHSLATGEVVDGVEAVVERPDGSRIWAMVHISPVKDASGNVLGAINCFHDTTAIHETSTSLQHAREELADFFENGAVAMHLVGADGTILRANCAELALLGYLPHEYIGHDIREFHADQESIGDILARLSNREKLDRYPARLRAKDGSVKHVLISSSVNWRNGEFINTRCVTVDVTDEIAARNVAKERDGHFKQLIDGLPAAVYTTDAAGFVTYYNKVAVELAGREPVLGKDQWCVTWKLHHPDGAPLGHDECPMAITLKENRPVRNVEALAERPDGSLVPFLPYPTPLRDSSGNLVGAVNMLVDISDRKQAEANQMLLFRELNHRVKNNMQTLHSLLSMAQRETSDARARLVLADAMRKVAAMAAAQQILYEEGHVTNFNAHGFISAVCAAVKRTLPANVSIDVTSSDGHLKNDHAMPLALILNELLTNAVKHGLDGREGGNIRVAFTVEQSEQTLVVKDDGPGFEMQDSSCRKKSSGLGLVAALARQIGGSFEVKNADGACCTVRFDRDPHLQ
ncbi:MAG TPA: PAS domain S-box protein [Lacipirellulaceae bacterium]|nr:PAS domain S-box protein [Lacipirellulaceae bacterium]